jgi:hypothetical protein
LPEKSVRAAAAAAGFAAAAPTLRALLAACCCRPRALPPAFAARLRAGVLADELDVRELEPLLRAVDVVLFRALEELLLRAVDALLREPEPVLREREPALLFRALDAAPLRELPDPDDDRLPLPPFDSAMALLL